MKYVFQCDTFPDQFATVGADGLLVAAFDLSGMGVNAYDSRHNVTRREDAEGRVNVYTFDEFDRVNRIELFDDPALSNRLRLSEYDYDGNGNKVVIRSFTDESNPTSAQETLRVYDEVDRLVRQVDADSDDPLTGAGLGGDGIFDRKEYRYDENSNRTQGTDQRQTVSTYTYDAATSAPDFIPFCPGWPWPLLL